MNKLHQNMDYKIYVTDFAKEQLDSYINYIINRLKNRQAAKAVMDDYCDTISSLSVCAGSLALLQDEDFRRLGYRRINFSKHRYFLLYRVVKDLVIVDAIYHSLQDYKKVIR